MRKKIVILGSTGSIGTQTLDVVRDHPDHLEVVGLSAKRNRDLLQAQISEFKPKIVALESNGADLDLPAGCRLAGPGLEGLTEVSTWPEADTVVVATVGAAGLVPTLAGLRAGKSIALANKEVLVMGGDILMPESRNLGRPILPIDSEHSAILQCLQGENRSRIRRIVITASGGPFRTWEAERIRSATLAEALNHPTWAMGNKITIDSATLMNKGLEIIEAHHLFGLSVDRIDVVIHPQSIIHSMVEFEDGAVMAQMGLPDMKVLIQFALTYPDRLPRKDPYLDLPTLRQLTFEEPDFDKFPCLRMAYEVCRKAGGYPAVFSVANEEAVAAFFEGKIRFGDIAHLIEEELSEFEDPGRLEFETLLEIEKRTRVSVKKRVAGLVGAAR